MVDFTVLTVDDDMTQLELVDTALASGDLPSIDHIRATTIAEAKRIFAGNRVDMIIADFFLPDGDGLEFLDHVKSINPLVNVIIITGHESIENSVSAMKRGADDYLVKPINGRYLIRIVRRILESRNSFREAAHLSAPHHLNDTPDGLIFQSMEMANAVNIALRGAQSVASVLIRGESGTGKELFARLIHNSGPRHSKPFIAVNIAALPESVIESELFGHRKGAFTGATANREGRFYAADGGTLFLDEIGDMPPTVQVKLLRALQFKQIEPVGADEPVDVDVRIIAATNRNLEELIEERRFREDLYYRLNVLTIEVPPLRRRKEDILPLVEHTLHRLAKGKPLLRVSPAAMDRLMRYDFPGNVRELENIVERATLLATGTVVEETDLPGNLQLAAARSDRTAAYGGDGLAGKAPDTSNGGATPRTDFTQSPTSETENLDQQLAEVERRLILEALDATSGNQSKAAQRLGIGERRLRSRMERLEISNPFK